MIDNNTHNEEAPNPVAPVIAQIAPANNPPEPVIELEGEHNNPQLETIKEYLDEDVFTLMMIAESYISSSWVLGIFCFLFQIALVAMILVDEIGNKDPLPFNVSLLVRVAQCFCLLLFVTYQTDIMSSIRYYSIFATLRQRMMINPRIPIVMKILQGTYTMIVSLLILMQATTVVDLLKDFVALMVIADVDDQMFKVAANGYLGEKLQQETTRAKDLELSIDVNADTLEARKASYAKRVALFNSFGVNYIFVPFLVFMFVKPFAVNYPNCEEHFELAKIHYRDAICYGGPLNTLVCGFEGKDCIEFNLAYPLCKGDNLVNVQAKVGNGVCDKELGIRECDFDGGDCCPYEMFRSPSYGDGFCNGGLRSTSLCGFDGGGCHEIRRKYPNCTLDELVLVEGSEEVILGDGICDSDIYNTEACGFENGDCKKPSD